MVREEAALEGPFVRVRELSKRFGPDWALSRANFALLRGQMALLTGANGSGKTTLIQCLATALLPDFGEASIAGHDLVTGRDEVRLCVAALTQTPGAYGGLSARENLALADAVLHLGRESAIESLLLRVGLAGRQDVPLETFSAGMKQRFALARLALLQRDLVLLDEPETHLDAAGLNLLGEMISEWKARGTAIVCATHAPERFRSLGSFEVRLAGGHAHQGMGGA